MNRRWVAAVAAGVAIALVAFVACTSSSGSTANPPPKVPSFTTSAPRTSVAPVVLPKGCASVAAASDVDGIVGHQLVGSSTQVVGIPQAAIGRLGRLDCYYGIPPGAPLAAAVVAIGIASYVDAATAQHRAMLTVNSARNSGAATSTLAVGSGHGVLIAGPQSQELVLAQGNETVLVTAANGVLAAGKVGPGLVQLAQKALGTS